MSKGTNAIDDDDDLATLMPNVAKLIRSGESNSLESKGSTSMSFSGNSVKHNSERQSPKPNRQRQRESVFREVANKFLRRGATIKRVSKLPALATLSSNCRVGSPSPERWRNANTLGKENVRPKVPTLVKQGARLVQQQKMEMRDASQRVARKLRKLPSHSEGSNYFSVNSKMQRADKSNTADSEHLAQSAAPVTMPTASFKDSQRYEHLAQKSERAKAKLYRTTMPLNLSELKEEFAEIDGEDLEEEEVSMAHMSRIAPVVASEILLDHGEGMLERPVELRKDLSRSEREKQVSNTAKARFEGAVLPIYSHGHRKEGVGTCTRHSTSRKTPVQDQDVLVSEPAGRGNDAVLNSGHDPNAIPCPMRHLNTPNNHDLDDGNQGDKCSDDENPPRIEQDSASLLLKGLNDQPRNADKKSTSCHLEVCPLGTSGKGASICAEMAYAEDSCNHKIGCSPPQPSLGKPKATVADGSDENAARREGSVSHLSSTLRGVHSAPPTAKNPSEEEDVVDIPLQGGNFSTRDNSPTPPCVRRWRVLGINQRRLVFESDSDSKQKAVSRAMDSDSGDFSVSTVEFKGRTNSAAGIISRDGRDFDVNMTSLPDQEAKLTLADGKAVSELVDRDRKRYSAQTQFVSHIEGAVDREKLLTVPLSHEGDQSAFKGTGEMGKGPYCFTCVSPQAGGSTECLKIRGVGKRTWANLGAPIDGGREWKEGRRVSTRIKSRPLDWWRGERMLYGRVHSSKFPHMITVLYNALTKEFETLL